MRRFNYTGRKKILQGDVFIALNSKLTETPELSLSADLKGYDFSDTALVVLEAQDKTRFARIEFGTALSISAPRLCSLTEFDDAEALNLTLKVIEPNDGQLLGTANRLKFRDAEEGEFVNREGILPVVSTDLSRDGVLWKVDFTPNDARLHIERTLGSREQVVRSQLFKGFILPAAMRIVLERILRSDWDTEFSDPSELSTKWLLFVQQLGWSAPEGLKVSDNVIDSDFDEQLDDWLDGAVRLLANQIGIRETIVRDFIDGGVWK